MVVLANWAWLIRQGWPRRWVWLMRHCRARQSRPRQLRSPNRRKVVVVKCKRKTRSRRLEQFLNKVCIIHVDAIENSSCLKYIFKGGGVFISKHGLIATCDHLFEDSDKTVVGIQIRRHGKKENFIKANILFRYPQLDLAILSIETSSIAKFRHVKLNSTPNVDWGQSVVSVSNAQTPFSISRGIAAYPFPKDTELPEPKPIGHKVEDLNDGEHPLPRFLHCKPDGAIHQPDVPVVVVHGNSAGPGTSGCPIFKEKNKRFIGISLISGHGFTYCLPSSMIFKVLKNEVEKVEKASSSAGEGRNPILTDWWKDLF